MTWWKLNPWVSSVDFRIAERACVGDRRDRVGLERARPGARRRTARDGKEGMWVRGKGKLGRLVSLPAGWRQRVLREFGNPIRTRWRVEDLTDRGASPRTRGGLAPARPGRSAGGESSPGRAYQRRWKSGPRASGTTGHNMRPHKAVDAGRGTPWPGWPRPPGRNCGAHRRTKLVNGPAMRRACACFADGPRRRSESPEPATAPTPPGRPTDGPPPPRSPPPRPAGPSPDASGSPPPSHPRSGRRSPGRETPPGSA